MKDLKQREGAIQLLHSSNVPKKKMKLHTEIDPQNILTENQTWLFWSGHHRSQTRQNSST